MPALLKVVDHVSPACTELYFSIDFNNIVILGDALRYALLSKYFIRSPCYGAIV